ncbi:MAG: SPFH domain-containing protein [Phycisphaerae bacterium]
MPEDRNNKLDPSDQPRVNFQPYSPDESQDQATRSLADALRVGFRLLTFIMLLVLVMFALSGFESVDSGEMAVKYMLGDVGPESVVGPGLAYTLPFPFGEIEKINTRDREMIVEEFWLPETPGEKLTQEGLRGRRVTEAGLRPGVDGALLTGDRYLIHARPTVTWSVQTNTGDVLRFVRNVQDADRLVYSAVCSAAVRVAATMTAESIYRGGKDRLFAGTRELAQKRLDQMQTGIRIGSIAGVVSVPVRAIAAYDAAGTADSQFQRRRDLAIRNAQTTLSTTAGEAYMELVGRPWAENQQRQRRQAQAEGREYDLVGQYIAAREADEDDRAAEILRKIDRLLVSTAVAGEANQVVEQAQTYRARYVQALRGRLKRFNDLRKGVETEKDMKVLINRLWADTLEEIRRSPTLETVDLKGTEKVLNIDRDPEVANRRAEEALRQEEPEVPEDEAPDRDDRN